MQRTRKKAALDAVGIFAIALGYVSLSSTLAWAQPYQPLTNPGAPPPTYAPRPSGPLSAPPVSPPTREQIPPPTPSGPTPGQATKLIVGVEIVGNESVTEAFVRSQLRTKRDREFNPEIVQGDVRRLASTGRFHDVRTYTQDVSGGVIVTFEVFESPTIRYIRYLGNRGISDKMLSKQDGLEVGEPLNRYAVEEGRRKIEEFYHTKGFSKTQVSIMEGDKPEDRGAVFVIDESQLERIASVKFVGNMIASDSRLKTLIKSKPGFLWYLFRGQLDRKKIDEDVVKLTSYYRNLGFFNARIGRELAFNEKGDWATLTFVIDEGPRFIIRNVSVVGNERFGTEDLVAKLNLASGDYFDMGKMNRDVGELTDIYGAHGHIFANIEADPRFLEEPGQLDLVYNIEEGGVWRASEINVHIEGEYPHTRESVVLNRLSIRPGDIIDNREVRASERRLIASQLFANNPAQGQKPRVVIRPPELQKSMESLATTLESPGEMSYRGQSPDEDVPLFITKSMQLDHPSSTLSNAARLPSLPTPRRSAWYPTGSQPTFNR